MRRITRATVAIVMAFSLGACGIRIPFVSSTTGGPFFETKLCGVLLDGKSKTGRLRIELAVIRALPRNAVVETDFQNPLEKSVLTARRVVTGNERTLEMISPPFAELRAGRYETITRVFASADSKQVLGLHTYVCESLVDARELGPGFR